MTNHRRLTAGEVSAILTIHYGFRRELIHGSFGWYTKDDEMVQVSVPVNEDQIIAHKELQAILTQAGLDAADFWSHVKG
ncbi:MAG: type II toxin-antitoxin system HicA family toxin [Dehalococcoidia bacterium]